MSDFESLFSQEDALELIDYSALVEYFEENFNKNGLYVTIEQESPTSTRFDFEDETSVWVNGAAVEGTLSKRNKKLVEKVIKSAPIKVKNYVRFM